MLKIVRPSLSLLACLFLVRAILSADGSTLGQDWLPSHILYGITDIIIVPETLLYELFRLVFTGLPPHLIDLSIGGTLELCSIFNLMLITAILGVMDGLEVLRQQAIGAIENALNVIEELIQLIDHVRQQRLEKLLTQQNPTLPFTTFNLSNSSNPSSLHSSKSLSPPMPNACIPNYQGQMREVTVLFCDIRGYTALVENNPPHLVIQQLNEYFSAMTQVIFQHHGRLDKYMGDGLMAYFEPTDGTLASSAVNGVRAALAMETALKQLNQRWSEQGLPVLDIGMGIHSGVVFVGNIGSQMKMDFTIIGDTVNLAARLEPMNKIFKTRIIISDATYRCVKEAVKTQFLGKMPIRGKKHTVKVYNVIQTTNNTSSTSGTAPLSMAQPMTPSKNKALS